MYQISVSYDSNPLHYSKNYADALEAFESFAKFTDWGLANDQIGRAHV